MKKINLYFMILIVCTTFIIQLDGANPVSIKNEAAIFLLIAGMLLFYFRNRVEKINFNWKLVAVMAAYPGISFIALILSKNPLVGITPFMELVCYSGLSLFIIICNKNNLDQGLELAFIVASTSVAVFGLKQALFPSLWDPGYLAPGKAAVYSLLGNSNLTAAFLVFGISITTGAVLKSQKQISRRLGIILIILQIACLVATRSKTGFIAFAISLICWGISARYFRLRLQHPGLRTAMTISVILLMSVVAIGFIAPRISAQHTAKGRWLIWTIATKVWLDHPLLGVGPGNYELYHINYQADVYKTGRYSGFYENASYTAQVHSEPLQVLVNSGPGGLFLFLLIIMFAFWAGWRTTDDPSRRGYWCGWCGVVLFSLFNNTFHSPPLALAFWISTGLLLTGHYNGKECMVQIPKKVRICIIGILITLSTVAGIRLVTVALSNRLERINDVLNEQGEYSQAVTVCRKAVKLNPVNGYCREKLALSLFSDGQFQEALAELDTAERFCGDVGIPYLRADIATRLGKYEQAVKIYQFISSSFPTHITPHFMLGQMYLKLNDLRSARREFRAVIGIKPSSHNLKLDRGKVNAQKEIARYFLERI